MAFELDHERARKLAKALMARTGREIKLKDIYNDIGSLFGMNGDAMMHALKKKGVPGAPLQTPDDGGVDPVTGLMTQAGLIARLERDRSGTVLLCLIHLGSLSAVTDRHGDVAGTRHLVEFANLLRPDPGGLFSRRMAAYAGGSFFLIAMPTVIDDDHQRLVNATCREWGPKLERRRQEKGLDIGHCHEFGGSALILRSGPSDREKLLRNIETMKVKAVNQVKARRELSAFPVVRMLH